jgi:hypothetical protein
MGTAFTYQGRLLDGANPADGTYSMYFTLYDASSGGNLIASQPTNTVSVSGGLFTVDLDFGAASFDGSERWLQINVRTNDGVGVDLSPRTRLAPAPHAIYASTSGTVINGAIQVSQLGTPGGPPSPGQVLSYNGSSLAWQTPSGGLWSLNGADIYYNSGNVGIGTTTPSAYGHGGSAKILEVNNGDTAANSQAHLMLYSGVNSILNSSIGTITWAQPGGMAAHIAAFTRSATPGTAAGSLMFGTRGAADPASTVRMVIQDDGNVGIGTETPASKLHVQGDQTTTGNLSVGGDVLASSHSVQFDNIAIAYHQWAMEPQSPGILQFVHSFTDHITGISGSENVLTMANGYVGIGTDTPLAKLEVQSSGSAVGVRGSSQGNDGVVGTSDSDGKSGVFGYTTHANGWGGFFMNTAGGEALHAEGNAYINGSATVNCLTINGGCDVAEPFHLSTPEIPKGSVVVIDENNPGQLKLSEGPYDKRVAGILSGANGVHAGICLSQQGFTDGGQNVALSGRVYVLADASNSPINPGDLLTSSNTPGHAMRVSDHARAQGAILGKAMTGLNQGRGFVLVLVSLQ